MDGGLDDGLWRNHCAQKTLFIRLNHVEGVIGKVISHAFPNVSICRPRRCGMTAISLFIPEISSTSIIFEMAIINICGDCFSVDNIRSRSASVAPFRNSALNPFNPP